jgi:preprotein translocase subunit SecA
LLLGEDVHKQVLEMLESVIGRLVLAHTDARTPEEWDYQGILVEAEQTIMPPKTLSIQELEQKATGDFDLLKKILYDTALALYEEKEEKVGTDNLRGFERFVLLRTIDNLWMEHLQNMDDLREGIGLRAYAQQDPLIVYKIESYQMFQGMMEAIQEEVIRFLFMMQISEEAPRQRRRAQNIVTNRGADGEVKVEQRKIGRKVGRNDPCPCGSGKKYKKCCGMNP